MRETLHVTDGDCTAGTLKLAGFGKNGGRILCWRDALVSGPVPHGLSLVQLSRLRSLYWTKNRSNTGFSRRNTALAKCKDYGKIVLWFASNCELCQLSLIQVLSWLKEQGDEAERLSWVAVHGGEFTAPEIAGLYSSRRPVTRSQMQVAAKAWNAFRQPSPVDLIRLVRSDLRAQPGLLQAITRLMQEYPNRRTGLSRMEGMLLREVQKRKTAQAATVVGSVLITEKVGDLLLFEMLSKLVKAPHPLIEFAEPLQGKFDDQQFRRSILKLSEVGQRVLSGKENALLLNGIDRWIGGVHLKGRNVRWCWDGKTRKLIQVKRGA